MEGGQIAENCMKTKEFWKIGENCMKTKEFQKIAKNCMKTKEFGAFFWGGILVSIRAGFWTFPAYGGSLGGPPSAPTRENPAINNISDCAQVENIKKSVSEFPWTEQLNLPNPCHQVDNMMST